LLDKNLVMERLRASSTPNRPSIVDLNMVRDIVVADGTVAVKIALTVAHCPLAKTLQTDVENAVRSWRALSQSRSIHLHDPKRIGRVEVQASGEEYIFYPENGPTVVRGLNASASGACEV